MGLKVEIRGSAFSLKKFIQVLSSGVNAARATFYSFVSIQKFELKFNAQSIYLSEYLNQVFDPAQKRIYIVNDATLFESYFYRTSESILAADQLYLFRTSETITDDEQVYLDKGGASSGNDFQVAVPAALSSLVAANFFSASINKYKLPDKGFQIITY